jgi:hypothetical protein
MSLATFGDVFCVATVTLRVAIRSRRVAAALI